MENDASLVDIVLLIIVDNSVSLHDRQSAATLLKKSLQVLQVTQGMMDEIKQYKIAKIFDAMTHPNIQFQIIGKQFF